MSKGPRRPLVKRKARWGIPGLYCPRRQSDQGHCCLRSTDQKLFCCKRLTCDPKEKF